MGDPGDLGRCERDDDHRGIVAIDDVEVVEVAPGGAQDDDPLNIQRRYPSRKACCMADAWSGAGSKRQ